MRVKEGASTVHAFLRAVGFSRLRTKKELDRLIMNIVQNPTEKVIKPAGDDTFFVQIYREFGPDFGISVVGECDAEGVFSMEYYFPYIKGDLMSGESNVQAERHAAHESYAGVCEDANIGVAIIFYLNNPGEFRDYFEKYRTCRLPDEVYFSGLSNQACVLLEVNRKLAVPSNSVQSKAERNKMIMAAKAGDRKAIESLTMEDMDTYTMISRRIKTEDVYSIVESYFMPYGIESDQYSILGTILDVHTVTNQLTGEELYRITVNCNELVMPILIHKEDLYGEPELGRRLKASVWLQGSLSY